MELPEPGDLLEFFDGEGFVSGTYMESEERELGLFMAIRVGNETQWVHRSDVMAILKEKEDRETDLPLVQERFRLDR